MLTDRQKYAATLALAIERIAESAQAGEPQKLALRALWSQADAGSATFRMYENILTVDGEPVTDTPYMKFLAERLAVHNVVELVVARHAEATELLALTRGLAANPPGGRIKERLRDVGSSKVMVIIEQPGDFGAARNRRTPGVSQAFERIELDEAAKSEWNKFLDNAATKSEEHSVDIGMAEGQSAQGVQGVQSVQDVQSVPDVPAKKPGYAPDVRAPDPRTLVPQQGLSQPQTLQASSPMGIALARLLGSPYGKNYLELLTQFQRQAEEALRRDNVAEVIDAVNTLIELEAKAPAESTAGGYGATLRRLLTGATLAQIAPYLLESRRQKRAAAVLTRGREVSLDILIGLLASAQTLGERLIYLDVVRTLPQGVDRVITLFQRRELQVLCNIAEVAGEGRLEEAAPYIANLVGHADLRVRRAALVALAKIGSRHAVEPLRRVLSEGAPELRHLVATSVNGPHARALTGPLVAAIESETKTEVVREYCRALGRIGTSEAVQALAKVAEPGGMLLGRKPVPRRLAAMEGLWLANATAALQALSQDSDSEVRETAREALAAPAQNAAPGARISAGARSK